jgi:hypothetical protein
MARRPSDTSAKVNSEACLFQRPQPSCGDGWGRHPSSRKNARLKAALLVAAQHQRQVGRVEVEPHHVANLQGPARVQERADECKGQNDCKGKGFVMTSSAEECTQKGGHPAS